MGNGIPVPPSQTSAKAPVDDAQARANSAKVSQHINPPRIHFSNSTTTTQQATGGTSGQANNAANNGGNNGGYQQQYNPNMRQHNPQQQSLNPALSLDFSLLNTVNMTCQQFLDENPLGKALVAGAKEYNTEIKTKFDSNYNAILIWFGDAQIYYIMGMNESNSPMYQIPHSQIMNTYRNGQNQITGTCMAPFSNNQPIIIGQDVKQRRLAKTTLVFFEDDVALRLHAVLNTIFKAAFPQSHTRITEDQYVSNAYGFSVIDTRNCNDEALKQQIVNFKEANNPSALVTPGIDYVAIRVSEGWGNQFGQFGQFGGYGGFNGGFNNGFGFAGNSFGMNQFGGYEFGGQSQFGGMYGMQQPQGPKSYILACAKYHLRQEKMPDGSTRNIARITEITESFAVIEGFLKYIVMQLISEGNQVEIAVDIGKVTPDVRDVLTKYFMMNSPYGGYGPMYHTMVTYINPSYGASSNGVIRRIHPETITPKVFQKYFPDAAKDSKFPKSFTKQEDQVAFENAKAKVGFSQVINPGELHLVFNMQAAGALMNEYNFRMQAHAQNMTLKQAEDSYRAAAEQTAKKNGQQVNNQQGQAYQQPSFFNPNQFGGGMAFGGNAFGMNQFGGNQFGQFGQFSQFGMQGNAFQNNMMGGMNQFGATPFGGNQFGGMQGNPYCANPYQPNMMGGMNQFQNGGYHPGMMGGSVAGGAFPAGNSKGNLYVPN